jgi:hypothetical protein
MQRQESRTTSDLAALWHADWDYPDLAAQLPSGAWAWQFLRRNEEYKEDWLRVLERARAAPTWEEGFIRDPTFREAAARYASSARDEGTIYDPEGRERWGLVCGYHDPRNIHPKNLFFMRPFGVVTRAATLLFFRESLAPEIRDDTMLVSFDPSQDLECLVCGSPPPLRVSTTAEDSIRRPGDPRVTRQPRAVFRPPSGQ